MHVGIKVKMPKVGTYRENYGSMMTVDALTDCGDRLSTAIVLTG